jgi:phenylpropionate dioxygenase-like ring-hydroxylating dioxygenase large terminal subunit
MGAAEIPKLPPTPMESAPRPELGTQPIPKQRYTSREFALLEWERMWTRTWLLAGLERDIPEPGDYFTFELGRESILVIRQRSGAVAARYNVCKHRGNRLREPGLGHASSFTCLFHGWRYGIDGALKYAQDPETFPQGCPEQGLSLTPVRCDTWGGFVFVNLAPDPEPLRGYLEPLPAHLDPYHFDEMRILDDWTVEVDCNWKTSVDAFNESYHIAGTHPDTLDVNDDTDVPLDCYERHSRMRLKLAVASPRHPEHGKITRTIRESFLAAAGIDPSTFRGEADDVRPAIAKAVREVQGPALGADFSELRDEQLVDDFHYTVFPNVTLNIFGRSAWLFRHRPHPSSPDKMLFDFLNLLRAPAMDIPRPDHQHIVLGDDFAHEPVGGGGQLMGQDFYNLPRIQNGMHSRGFSGLHLGEQELRIRHFHAVLDRYLDEAARG